MIVNAHITQTTGTAGREAAIDNEVCVPDIVESFDGFPLRDHRRSAHGQLLIANQACVTRSVGGFGKYRIAKSHSLSRGSRLVSVSINSNRTLGCDSCHFDRRGTNQRLMKVLVVGPSAYPSPDSSEYSKAPMRKRPNCLELPGTDMHHRGQVFASFGKQYRSPTVTKQRCAAKGFQQFDLMSDRRGGYRRFIGGLLETQMVGGGTRKWGVR